MYCTSSIDKQLPTKRGAIACIKLVQYKNQLKSIKWSTVKAKTCKSHELKLKANPKRTKKISNLNKIGKNLIYSI